MPHRIIDTRTESVVDFEGFLARCSDARVVALGEQHDDPATHVFELAVLQGLQRRRGDVVLSLEMFERDVQSVLDRYLAGEITEDEFLATSRPWGNYPTDYRPMVEFAREHNVPVVAANVPRPLAALVARQGMESTQFDEEERAWISPIFEAPQDAYWDAFIQTMQMPGMNEMGVNEASLKLYYEAQVLKDEAMAYSVSSAAENFPSATVFHVTGAFHIADYLGTYPRIRRELPGADTVSILVLPVDDLLAPIPSDAPKADYIVLVLAPPSEAQPGTTETPQMPPMPPMPGMPPSRPEG